ncbi:MAG: Calx-beta domain-containing protein [Acidobacteriota bacterium]
MTELALGQNNMTGTLPASLATLTSLEFLALNRNQLTGEFPAVTGLSLLSVLRLFENDLSGSLPSGLSSMTSLVDLRLDDNAFSGPIPDLSALSSLELFRASKNQLTGGFPSLPNSVVDLDLSVNQLGGSIPASITSIPLTANSLHDNFFVIDPSFASYFSDASRTSTRWDSQYVPPANLQASVATSSSVDLSWDNQHGTGGFDSAVEFEIDVSSSQGTTTQTAPVSAQQFTVTGLTSNLTYSFVVRMRVSRTTGSFATADSNAAMATPTTGGFTQRDILQQLYDSTSGPQWNRQSDWLTAASECDWQGVECDGGLITELRLAQNNMQGSLPGSLADLSSLRILRVSENQLSGAFPAVTALSALEELWLFENDFDGSLPSSFSTMSSLREVRIDANRFNGSIPDLSGLSSLQSFRASRNRFDGPLPGLPGSLTFLDVSQNELRGALPNSISSIPLTSVFLHDNFLQIDPSLASYFSGRTSSRWDSQYVPPSSLQAEGATSSSIDVSWVNAHGNGGFADVVEWQLERFSTQAPTQFLTIAIASQTFTDSGLQPDLDYRYRIRMRVTRSGVAQDLFSDWSTTDTAMPLDGSITQRQILEDLYNSTGGPSWNRNAGWLSAANECDWGDTVVCEAGSVVELRLGDNNLQGSIPGSIVNLSALRILKLNRNSLSGTFPSVTSLSNLEELDLAENQFAGSVPDVSGLNSLQVLTLDQNLFQGSIPDMTNLSSLVSFRASKNELNGDFPGLPAGVLFVDVSQNLLTGALPLSVTNLTQVTDFFLHDNFLEVPSSLASYFSGRASNGWRSQYVPPLDFQASAASATSLVLSWQNDHDSTGFKESVQLEVVQTSLSSPAREFVVPIGDEALVVDSLNEGESYSFEIAVVVSRSSGEVRSTSAFTDGVPSSGGGGGGGGTTSTVSFLESAVSVEEGDGSVTLVVRKTGSASATVEVAGVSGTATEGEDFELPTTRQLTWGSGDQTSRAIVVDILSDSDFSEGSEMFELRLTPGSGAALGDNASSEITIVDSSAIRTLSFSEPRYDVSEGDEAATLVVQLLADPPLTTEVTGRVQVLDSTAAPGDFVGPIPSTVTFPPGTTTAEVRLELVDNSDFEPEKTKAVLLELSSTDVTVVQPSEATVVIREDDVEPEVEELLTETSSETPVVSYSRRGFQALAWSETRPNGRRQVRLRVLDRAGLTLVDFNPSGSPLDQLSPALDWTSNEELVLAWREAVGSRASRDGNLVALIFSGPIEEFAESSGDLELQADPQDTPREPQVAADDSGNVVVTWREDDGVFGQVFDRGPDRPSAPKFEIDAATSGSFSDGPSDTASGADGETVIVWRRSNTGGGSEIRMRRIVDGRIQPAVVVDRGPGLDAPRVTMLPEGRWVVVYERPEGARTFISGATFARSSPDTATQITTLSEQGQDRRPSIASNASGDVVVVWEFDGRTAAGRFYGPTLEPLTDVLEIAPEDPEGAPTALDVSIDDSDQTTVTFERRRGGVRRVRSTQFKPSLSTGSCGGDEALCLLRERFTVTAAWRTRQGSSGGGTAVPLTTDSGYMWFFDESNVEMAVKLLDGCAINDHFWVFAGGLTDVEVTLTVTDTLTGATSSHFNPLGRPFSPIADTRAIAECDAQDPLRETPSVTDLPTEIGFCNDDQQLLCLADSGRFRVGAEYRTQQGDVGSGEPQGLSEDTGYFWFFDEENVEVVVKVLDGCAINGNYWVFAAGLSDQFVELTVEDPVSGLVKIYTSPLKAPFAPVVDVEAFPACR